MEIKLRKNRKARLRTYNADYYQRVTKKKNEAARRAGLDAKDEEAKERARQYAREYYRKNKARLRQKARQYYKQNKEKVMEYQSKYNKTDQAKEVKKKARKKYQSSDLGKATVRAYVEKHRDEINERSRRRYVRDKEKRRKYQRRYYLKNREKILAQQAERNKKRIEALKRLEALKSRKGLLTRLKEKLCKRKKRKR